MLIPPNLRKLIILIAYVLSDKKMNIDADLGSNVTLVSSEMARKVEEMRSETKRAKSDQEKIQNLAPKLIDINSSYRVKKNENEKLREEAGRLSNRIKELEYIKAFPFPVALVDDGSEVSKKIRREMERLPNPTSTAEVRERQKLYIPSRMLPQIYRKVRKMEEAIHAFKSKINEDLTEEMEDDEHQIGLLYEEDDSKESGEAVMDHEKRKIIEKFRVRNGELRELFGQMNAHTGSLTGFDKKKINSEMNQIGKLLEQHEERLDEMTFDVEETKTDVQVEELRMIAKLQFEATQLLRVLTGENYENPM